MRQKGHSRSATATIDVALFWRRLALLIPQLFTTVAPEAARVSIPFWLELLSVMVGGLTGGLRAAERKLDFVGATGLALVCGLGGGLIRDVSMQVGDVYMLSSDIVFLSTIAAGLLGYYFSGVFLSLEKTVIWLDIVSVGLFTVTGADKALVYGFSPLIAVFLGTMTGVGGGMLCDALLGEVPRIFRGGSALYAVCSATGGVVYCLCAYLQLAKPYAALICVVFVVLLRILSLRFGIVTPEPTDLTPRMVEATKRAVQLGIDEGVERAKKHEDRPHHRDKRKHWRLR